MAKARPYGRFAAAGWALLWAFLYFRRSDLAPGPGLLPLLLPRLDRLRWAVLPGDAFALLGWFWFAWTGLALGSFLLRRLRLDGLDRLEKGLLALALGWGAAGLGMLVLGLCGLWKPTLVLALLGALLIGLASAATADLKRTRPPELPALVGWDKGALGLLAFLALFNLMGAFVPETFYDALLYHLALPDLYWLHGRVFPTPQNLFSGVPMLTEMLYAVGLLTGREQGAHLIHWSLGVGAALGLYSLGSRLASPRAGLWAAVLFYATPLVGVLSWKSGVELSWTFFQVLSALALLRACEDGDRRWAVAAGLLCGLAMGTKYPAWLLAAAEGALLLRSRPKSFVPFALAAGAAAGAWPLKDLLFYGNPLYPFFDLSAPWAGPDWRRMMHDAGSRDWCAVFSGWSGLASFLAHPWTELTAQSLDTYALGPVFLLGLPLLLVPAAGAGRRRLRSLFLVLWGAWALGTTMPRFFLPAFALACVLYALPLADAREGRWSAAARAGALVVLASNALWIMGFLKTASAEPVLFGWESRSDYLSRAFSGYGQTAYPAVEFANENLPRDARLLFVGDGRGYGCRLDYLAASYLDPEPLAAWARESPDPAGLSRRLSGERIAYLLVNFAEIARFQKGPWQGLPPEKLALLRAWWTGRLTPLFEEKRRSGRGVIWDGVYAIGPAGAGTASVPSFLETPPR